MGKMDLMTNRESGERRMAGCLGFRDKVADIAAHLELNRSQKVVKLGLFPLGHQLDAAVGEVSDPARNLEATRQRLAGVAEAHALNPAREMNSATNSRHPTPPAAVQERKAENPLAGHRLAGAAFRRRTREAKPGPCKHRSQANVNDDSYIILAVNAGAKQVDMRSRRSPSPDEEEAGAVRPQGGVAPASRFQAITGIACGRSATVVAPSAT